MDAHNRMNAWLQVVGPKDVKAICDGAKKQSHQDLKRALSKNDMDERDERSQLLSKVVDRSILKSTNATFYDRIYLRKYEPDEVRRYKQGAGLVEGYLDKHLEQEPYKGNPNELFKSLLKPRTRSNERQLSMNFQKKSKVQHKENS
jgi:hypothetical protein